MRFLKIFLVILGYSQLVLANDIIKDKTAFSFALCYEDYSTSRFWNKSGTIRPAFNHFHSTDCRTYLEYGVTAGDTVGMQGSWRKTVETLHGHSMGLTEVELTWKHVLAKCGHHTCASQFIGVIPFTNQFKPALRYGRFAGEAALFYICDFHFPKLSWWYDIKAGYRLYHGFPSDQLRSHVRVCCLYDCRFQLNAGAFLEYGVFNGKTELNANIIALYPNYRLLKAEFEAAYRLYKNLYASIGYTQYLWGNNVGTGSNWTVSAGLAF